MIPKTELDSAVELARKYKVGQLFLIGSALYRPPEEIEDYDFAVRNVPPGVFFKFYGELMMAMPKRTDLIDISGQPTKFNELVLKEGKLIYDRKSA